jgi:hypothetical protein
VMGHRKYEMLEKFAVSKRFDCWVNRIVKTADDRSRGLRLEP